MTRYVHHGLRLRGGSTLIPWGPCSHGKPCAYVSIRCSNQQLKTAAPCAAFSLTTESVKADVAFSSFSRHPVAFLPPCLIFHSDLSYSVPMECFYGCVKFAGIIIK